MTNEKLTQKKALEYVLTNCELPDDVKEKLEGMVETLSHRKAGERKPTAKQIESNRLREVIYDYLCETGESLTCSELAKRIPDFEDGQNQKVSGLMRALVAEGRVTKVIDHGKSLFSATR